MNLYDFSMINNKEMGILIDKAVTEDIQVYDAAWMEIDFIEKTSKPFDFVSKPTDTIATASMPKEIRVDIKTETANPIKENLSGLKFFSVTAMSKELGISPKELNSKFEKLNWIEKKNDETVLTSLGKSKGAQIKKGQYGDYIAWPETIMKEIK